MYHVVADPGMPTTTKTYAHVTLVEVLQFSMVNNIRMHMTALLPECIVWRI